MLFSKLKKQYTQGKLARDDYWRMAIQNHDILADYAQTLQNSDIKEINISVTGLSLTLHSGVILKWNPSDTRGSANTLVNHGAHEAEDSRFLFKAARHARCILDIGANAGYYTLHFGKCFPGMKTIHAFEPIGPTFAMLVENVKANELTQVVHCHPFGLSNKEEDVVFYVPAFSGSVAASMKNLHPDEKNQTIDAKVVVLDAFCEANHITEIDLIKMDVEGAEFFALEGAKRTLEKFKPILFVEILRKWSRRFGIEPNQTIRLLNELGYDCWAVANGQLVPFTEMTEATTQTNFFFIHKDRQEIAADLLA
jgi:FkbM family methyltransferase